MYLDEALQGLGVPRLSEFQKAEDSDRKEACVEELPALHPGCYVRQLFLQLHSHKPQGITDKRVTPRCCVAATTRL